MAVPGAGHEGSAAAGTLSVPSQAFILPFSLSKSGLWEDLIASVGVRAWKKKRRETEGLSASSVSDARSLSLQFVFCKTWYISVQKKKGIY